MSIRVTSAEVKEIMDNCTTSDIIVNTFITAASAVIDKVFSGNTSMSAVMLKEVERWLTAHMLASTLSRTTSEEKLGDAQLTYTGKWGEGLKSTSYGQMVLVLDVSGLMAKTGLKGASMYAIPNFDA
jgi:hypothetical protein